MSTQQHDPKTTAIISYITPVGRLIAYFAMYKDSKSSLAGFHLRQTLLLYIIGFAIDVFTRMFFWSFMFWGGGLLSLGFVHIMADGPYRCRKCRRKADTAGG